MAELTIEMIRAAQAAIDPECQPAECDECMAKALEAALTVAEGADHG